MGIQKITFKNTSGKALIGKLELPTTRHPHNFVIFAHCFTCTKNIAAVRNISRNLSHVGYGVLRFDFTGLGESDGDFEDTNFTGNIDDLVAAADFLAIHHKAPSLLIGHSLGGAAVLFAASKIDSVKAVATIGAPSQPTHVQHLLKNKLAEIAKIGHALVNIGGRDFMIKKQFVEDLQSKSLENIAADLRKAVLIMHAPQDTIVGIQNAEQLYKALQHPKSFVSLDGADHLLSRKEDSEYAGRVIAGWASRYIEIPRQKDLKTAHQVLASIGDEKGYTTQLKAGNHYMTADEPKQVGGNDFGPSPYELISAGLATCTAMTMKMYANRKAWELHSIEVHTGHKKIHAQDCENCESENTKIDIFERSIKIKGDLDEKQITRLMQIADKCPVHKTLHNTVVIKTKLLD